MRRRRRGGGPGLPSSRQSAARGRFGPGGPKQAESARAVADFPTDGVSYFGWRSSLPATPGSPRGPRRSRHAQDQLRMAKAGRWRREGRARRGASPRAEASTQSPGRKRGTAVAPATVQWWPRRAAVGGRPPAAARTQPRARRRIARQPGLLCVASCRLAEAAARE